MNRDKKIACILIAIILIMSVTSTQGTTLNEISEDRDAVSTALYLAGTLRYIEKYVYDAYWSDNFKEMEEALYNATNDCEYLSQVADKLADKILLEETNR